MDSTKRNKIEAVNVNAHLHTPYSFSAFDKLTDALDRAVAENVRVVGVNDFYSMDGYTRYRSLDTLLGASDLFGLGEVARRNVPGQRNDLLVDDVDEAVHLREESVFQLIGRRDPVA